MSLLVTCEHGGNGIPAPYETYFSGYQSLLGTHLGFDPGALELAYAIAIDQGAHLVGATVSRLLVDLNRSIGHPELHFNALREAPPKTLQAIIDQHYRPYRARVAYLVNDAIERHGSVLHLSCHSFTPSLEGAVRTADIGLLYDPKREAEKHFCEQWQDALCQADHRLTVRRNYPYRGDADGQTTSLRRHFDASRYLGIELEINQLHVFAGGPHWSALQRVIIDTLDTAHQRHTHDTQHAPDTSRRVKGASK